MSISHRHKLLLLVKGIRKAQYALRLNGTDQSITPAVFEPKSATWGIKVEFTLITAGVSGNKALASGPNSLLYLSGADALQARLKDATGSDVYTGTIQIELGVRTVAILTATADGFTVSCNGETMSPAGDFSDVSRYVFDSLCSLSGNFYAPIQIHSADLWDETGLQGGAFTKGNGTDLQAIANIPTSIGTTFSFDLQYVAKGANQEFIFFADTSRYIRTLASDALSFNAASFDVKVDGVSRAPSELTMIDGQTYTFDVTLKLELGPITRVYSATTYNHSPSVIANLKVKYPDKPVSFGPELVDNANVTPLSGVTHAYDTTANAHSVVRTTQGHNGLKFIVDVKAGSSYLIEAETTFPLVDLWTGADVLVDQNPVDGAVSAILHATEDRSLVQIYDYNNDAHSMSNVSIREITEFEYREYLTKNSVEDQGNGTAIGIQTGNVPRFGDELISTNPDDWVANDAAITISNGRVRVTNTGNVKGTAVFNLNLDGAGIVAVDVSGRSSSGGGGEAWVSNPFTPLAGDDNTGTFSLIGSGQFVIRCNGLSASDWVEYDIPSVKETTDLYFPNFDPLTNLVELPYIDSHYDFSQKGQGEYGEIIPNKIGSDGPELLIN
ncbi:MAG: hypothetical protein ACRBBW_13180, partial [Cellvibrionaceae bacterium]